jgi:hypothetical protein
MIRSPGKFVKEKGNLGENPKTRVIFTYLNGLFRVYYYITGIIDEKIVFYGPGPGFSPFGSVLR